MKILSYYDILIVLTVLAAVLFIVIRLCFINNHMTNKIRNKIHTNDPFYESRPDNKLTARNMTYIIAPCMAALIYIILRISGELDNPFS
ncbi:hypothetical protein [Ruminococcus flavefaciens]|uniref:hypothetical protein n=1 Tax=Ruminococcus flavefaciens TaxID=1265 RepID=UPI0026E9CDD8|nr:hypothetical protein [Ruminococcus flavefaciens]